MTEQGGLDHGVLLVPVLTHLTDRSDSPLGGLGGLGGLAQQLSPPMAGWKHLQSSVLSASARLVLEVAFSPLALNPLISNPHRYREQRQFLN